MESPSDAGILFPSASNSCIMRLGPSSEHLPRPSDLQCSGPHSVPFASADVVYERSPEVLEGEDHRVVLNEIGARSCR